MESENDRNKLGGLDDLGRVGGIGWARVNLPLAGGGLSRVGHMNFDTVPATDFVGERPN